MWGLTHAQHSSLRGCLFQSWYLPCKFVPTDTRQALQSPFQRREALSDKHVLTSHVSLQALQACHDDGGRQGPSTPSLSWARVEVDSATVPVVVSAQSVRNRNCSHLICRIISPFTVLTRWWENRTRVCSRCLTLLLIFTHTWFTPY